MEIKSQREKILKRLEKGKAINPLQALKLFGSMRLGARIYELRRQGYAIVTKPITQNGKTYAEYRMNNVT